MECAFDTDFTIGLFINACCLLFTIMSFVCTFTNSSMEQSLRGILLSFSLSNITGSGMFVVGIITHVCHSDDHLLDHIVMLTMVLCLSHLMLLILHYYITLTSSKTKKAVDFSGLILTSWITSGAVGSMIYISKNHEIGHILTIIVFLSILVLTVWAYFQLLKEDNRQKRILDEYRKTFLRIEDEATACKETATWNLTYLAIMLFTYIVCSIPWLVTEFFEIHIRTGHLAQSIALSTYSLNFLMPSFVCIKLKVKKWHEPPNLIRTSNRLRTISARGSIMPAYKD